MAILQSCCFWKTVRKGSYASAIYTLVYFGFSSIILLIYVNEEQEYLSGERKHPTGESILERGDVTPTTVIFNILFMACSLLMVISSILVIIALRIDKRELLLPWIVFMLGDLLIELGHLIYLALTERVIFEPVVGFLFTIDFFIMCLNCYCWLCVQSQYQEYRQGRGCRRIPLATPQIVVFVSQTDAGGATGTAANASSSVTPSRLKSPFVSTHQHTNISTIPEEEDQKMTAEEGLDTDTAAMDDGTCKSMKVTPSADSNDVNNCLQIPSTKFEYLN